MKRMQCKGGRIRGAAVFAIIFGISCSPPAWSAGLGEWVKSKAAGMVSRDEAERADDGTITQGQLKDLACAAADELDARLPGGAGDAIHKMVATWNESSSDDAAPVNHEQLWKIAKPIYDRLIAVTYADQYPWKAAEHGGRNERSRATLGEARKLFTFDFTNTDAAHDTNGDGIPDWWGRCYHITDANALALRGDGLTNLQAFQSGLNPNDFFNEKKPVLTMVGGNALLGTPGKFAPEPLIVSVTDKRGQPLYNAPVTFTVTDGGGTVQKTNLTKPAKSITVNADEQGQARVYFKLPAGVDKGHVSNVIASTGSDNTKVQAAFKETADDVHVTHDDPFDPTDMVASLNADGSADVTWTNNTDPADKEPINIQYRDRKGNWVTAITVPAGTTSCHIPPPDQSSTKSH